MGRLLQVLWLICVCTLLVLWFFGIWLFIIVVEKDCLTFNVEWRLSKSVMVCETKLVLIGRVMEWMVEANRFGVWNFVLIINLQRVYCVPHTCKFSLFVCLEEVWELIVSTLPQRLRDRGGVSLYWPMKIGGKVRTPGTPRWDCGRQDFVASY